MRVLSNGPETQKAIDRALAAKKNSEETLMIHAVVRILLLFLF